MSAHQTDLFALTPLERRILIAMEAIYTVELGTFCEPDRWAHLGMIHDAVDCTTEDGRLFCRWPRYQYRPHTVDHYVFYPALKGLIRRGLVNEILHYFGAWDPGPGNPYKGFTSRYRLAPQSQEAIAA